ncbi:MAG TPA: ABC transporter substrate-binding protein [Gemmatimonadales bacterium]|nr:ABC transporter substrate-binding protein [Gemmatimonadales bacterium]
MPAPRSILVASIVLLGACARPQIGGIPSGGGPSASPNEACLLSTGDVTTHAATITIGLTDAVNPRHAPTPRTDGERLVFRHLYETPVRIDCDGHVQPELAQTWVRDDDGRRWTFRLRDGAQFWDGAPVTAQEVVFGRSGAGYTLGAPEAGVVTVTLAKPRDEVPPLLGDAGLAVTKAAPDTSWPIGTGRYWATSATTTPQEIRAHTRSGDTLVFRFASGDARDLLDAGVDLVVTRDRALRDYAATLKNYTVVPLPWDRTYVFVTPEAGGTRFDGLEQAVRAEARRPEGGFWWLDLRPCGIGGPGGAGGLGNSPPASTGQRRILYSRTDPTARELAGRLAALSHAVATPRGPDDLGDAVTAGKDWGYIVALPRSASDPCRVAKDLLPAWSATMTALVDTRPTAIVRRGVARWTVDQDGTVHLAP